MALRVLQLLAACGAVVATAIFAYVQMFSQFQVYDDEGYVMVSVRTFLDGRPLYTETFTQYGPFYYLLAKLLYGVSGVPVGHDVTRLATVALWLATAALCAVFVYRLTSSFTWALAAYLQTVVHCTGLVGEPGHPQGLLLILLMGLLVIAARRPHATATFVLLGAVAGSVLLTKINIGVYAAAALGVSLLAVASRDRVTGAALAAASVAALALPFAVMRMHLSAWAMNYALTAALTIAACCIAAWRTARTDDLPPRRFGVFVAAFAATAGVVCVLTMLMGTSAKALLDGAVLTPVRFGGVFTLPWVLPSAGVVCGVVSVMLAAAVAGLSPSARAFQAVGVVLKVGFALLMAWAAVRGASVMVSLAPFVWVILLPPDRASWPLDRLLPRSVLCLLAALEILSAYPVAGNQQSWATVLLVPAAVICMADAMSVIARRAGRWPARAAEVLLLGLVLAWYYPRFPSAALLKGYDSLDPHNKRRVDEVCLSLLVISVMNEC